MLSYQIAPRFNIKVLPEGALAQIMDAANIPRECVICRRNNENNVYFEKNFYLRPVHLDLNLFNNSPDNLVWMCEFHRLSYTAYLLKKKLRGVKVSMKSFNI